MEELQEHFVEVLRQCIDDGMKLPFIVCAISPNGSALVMRTDAVVIAPRLSKAPVNGLTAPYPSILPGTSLGGGLLINPSPGPALRARRQRSRGQRSLIAIVFLSALKCGPGTSPP